MPVSFIDTSQAVAVVPTARAPQVDIGSVRTGLIDLRTEMAAGRVDLAIGAFEDPPAAFYQKRLFRQSYVSIVRQGHPIGAGLAQSRQFNAARHLVVTSTESPYDRINEALAKAGISWESSFSVPHFSAIPYIVSTTDLVATVPQKLADRVAGAFNLTILTSPLHLPSLQTNMFWHRRYNQDEGTRWLRGLIVEVFGE